MIGYFNDAYMPHCTAICLTFFNQLIPCVAKRCLMPEMSIHIRSLKFAWKRINLRFSSRLIFYSLGPRCQSSTTWRFVYKQALTVTWTSRDLQYMTQAQLCHVQGWFLPPLSLHTAGTIWTRDQCWASPYRMGPVRQGVGLWIPRDL